MEKLPTFTSLTMNALVNSSIYVNKLVYHINLSLHTCTGVMQLKEQSALSRNTSLQDCAHATLNSLHNIGTNFSLKLC